MAASVETLLVGPLDVNCYIIGCDEHKACAIVDPGDSGERILGAAEKRGWKVKMIINTHGHADDTGANAKIKEATGAPVLIHKDEAAMLSHPDMKDMAAYIGVGSSPEADRLLDDGDKIDICPCVTLEVLHTPGHSKGGVCLLFDKKLISGDTLFRMSIGRSDLPGGDMSTLLNSIRTKIFTLPDDIEVLPGHGEPTSVGYEKKNNPFLIGTFT